MEIKYNKNKNKIPPIKNSKKPNKNLHRGLFQKNNLNFFYYSKRIFR